MRSALLIGMTLAALQGGAWVFADDPPDFIVAAQQVQPAVAWLMVTDRTGKELATGNGFFVSADGKLLTSLRLIDKAKRVVAITAQHAQVPVDGVLATDSKNDLALLKLPVSHQPFLPLASAGQILVGAPVAIVTSPESHTASVTTGAVLIVRKLFADLRRIHIQAALGTGAGGAPVVNGAGVAIGMVRALVRDPRLYNLVVPAEAAARLLASAGAQPIAFLPQHKSGDPVDGEIFLTEEWRQVVMALELEEWEALLESAEALVQRFPGYAEAYACVGTACLALRRYDRATAAYQHVMQLEPENPVAWINLANSYGLQGRDAEAVQLFQKIVKVRPDFLVAWTKLGELYCRQGKFGDAIGAWQKAVQVAPENPAGWANLGVSYEGQGKLSDAVTAYRRAVQLESQYPFAWIRLGVTEGQLGQHAEARAAQRRAMELKPDFPMVWLSLDISAIIRTNLDATGQPAGR